MKVISWKNKPIFTNNNSCVYKGKKQFYMVKGITNAFDHMEFLKLTTGGNRVFHSHK